MLAFINQFLLTEQDILKIPNNIQLELIDQKINSVLKMKFDEVF